MFKLGGGKSSTLSASDESAEMLELLSEMISLPLSSSYYLPTFAYEMSPMLLSYCSILVVSNLFVFFERDDGAMLLCKDVVLPPNWSSLSKFIEFWPNRLL